LTPRLSFLAFETNYPQTLKYCIIVNAPAIFPMAYALVKPFLPDRTRRKIVVLRKLSVRWPGFWFWQAVNSTPTCMMQDLPQYIAPEYTPKLLGGTGPSPGDPDCPIRPVLGKVWPVLRARIDYCIGLIGGVFLPRCLRLCSCETPRLKTA
jgi:hypothetical protein